MTKRFASLILVLALGGTVLAGTPMHSGDTDAGMMDCCKKAMEPNNSPSVAAARLCCAMNCNQPGSTTGNTSQNFSQTGSAPTDFVTVAWPPASSLTFLRARYPDKISSRSKPAYIVHLALLI